MISWVAKKNINIKNINDKILNCVETKHFTNNGKNVTELKSKLKKLFEIDDDKEVLLTCNGALGLNTLVAGLNLFYNKKLKWIVQSFTFPCSNQGNISDSIIIDIDENMGPDIIQLNEKIDEYDGIIVTNCFGTSSNIELYENFCKKNNKLLLFDNAASSFTKYKNKNHLNFGSGSMVSLHHTKPIGFGEGGFIVFNKNLLESMEKIICFGFTQTDKYTYNIHANNYKMSEISCIYIDDYLSNLNHIREHHKIMINYFIENINKYNLSKKIVLLKNFSNYEDSLMSTIPIVFNNKQNMDVFIENNVEAKKYYYPLDKTTKNANNLFDNIICLPLNTDTNFKIIDLYIQIINKI